MLLRHAPVALEDTARRPVRPRTLVAAAVGLMTAVVAPGAADAQFARSGSPDVSFSATGPAGLSILGKSSSLTVTEVDRRLTVSVPLSSLSTGIGLRDKHMKEKYLETQKYPDAELHVARTALTLPDLGKELSADADATLTLHGQTKPVRVHYNARRDGAAYVVHGTMRVNMGDYGISVPSYLGVTVKPDVDVTVRFEAVDK